MARTYDFAGKSGQRYRYTLLEGQTIWPSGGNYLYVKMLKSGPKVVCAGETESLFRGYRERWDEAHDQHGATDIYLRLNITGAVRRAEMEDIVAEHRPAMNSVAEDQMTERQTQPQQLSTELGERS